METRRAESEATIHTISGQFKGFLPNVELAKLHWITLLLNLVFYELSLVNESLENKWKNSIFSLSTSFLWQLDILPSHRCELIVISVKFGHA